MNLTHMCILDSTTTLFLILFMYTRTRTYTRLFIFFLDVEKPIIVRMRGTNAAEAKKLIDVSTVENVLFLVV